MTEQSETEKFKNKIHTQLQDAKAQIEKLEAAAKGKMTQAETDAISGLKSKRQEIDKKLQDLKVAAATKAAQVQAEIEADMSKFKELLEQVHAKLKSHVTAK